MECILEIYIKNYYISKVVILKKYQCVYKKTVTLLHISIFNLLTAANIFFRSLDCRFHCSKSIL